MRCSPQEHTENRNATLYDARVEDLGPGDLVEVECVCGHTELLTATMLRTAGVAEHQKIMGLQRHMRCRECDALGRAIVSISWAGSIEK
jgi:hypothetical protein